ncbi:hypothetical protein AN960_15870 [Bacillus sp. FJAT-25509]|nr:hypothetical protein AN960_15870 [Bacillus sp. FJAT-25509]
MNFLITMTRIDNFRTWLIIPRQLFLGNLLEFGEKSLFAGLLIWGNFVKINYFLMIRLKKVKVF